jgi:alkylhydroperoxidase family enzyme
MSRYDTPIHRLRTAAQPERPAPRALRPYLDKVRTEAYRITDGDIDALKAAGFSEDEIFEHTVSAAVAAGLERLDAGLRALG